jgi:hypothetical protein
MKRKKKINLRPVSPVLQRENRENRYVVLRVSSARLETVQTLENTKTTALPLETSTPSP